MTTWLAIIHLILRKLIIELSYDPTIPLLGINLDKTVIQKDTWRRKWQPTPVFFPRDAVNKGAWLAAVHGVAESWMRLKQLSMDACIEAGPGNPLQCSCLENPRDRGAWWAAVYGVTKNHT